MTRQKFLRSSSSIGLQRCSSPRSWPALQRRDLPRQQQVPVPSSYPTRCRRLLAMILLLNFCNAYSSLHGNNHSPLPGDVYGPPPGNICQCRAWALWQSLPGTLASSLPGNTCQFPSWECLPVCMPCLGMLANPAWERLPVPCLGTFCSPCLGRFASSLPGNVCQCPALACLPVPALECFSPGRCPCDLFSCLSAPLLA